MESLQGGEDSPAKASSSHSEQELGWRVGSGSWLRAPHIPQPGTPRASHQPLRQFSSRVGLPSVPLKRSRGPSQEHRGPFTPLPGKPNPARGAPEEARTRTERSSVVLPSTSTPEVRIQEEKEGPGLWGGLAFLQLP